MQLLCQLEGWMSDIQVRTIYSIIFTTIMGTCAGCMGPNRRAQNYRVNRLTQNSPIKSRVSTSELPVSRNKDRIIDELNESKRKYQQNNLISTLINSPSNPNNQKGYNPIKAIRSSLHDSPQIYIRDSYGQEDTQRSSGMLRLKKVESNSFMDENVYESKYSPQRSPFISEFKAGVETVGGGMTSSNILGELKMNKNSQYNYKKKGLPNIPELVDEESKTPGYVKEIRKQNGEDVKPTDLQHVPRVLQAAPKLNLFHYLKDLS